MEHSSSHKAQTVLCYGHDTTLLQTRRWLIEQDGFACSCAESEAEFRSILSSALPDLIMLCQTLSQAECEAAKQIAAEHAPQARVLVLFTRTTTRGTDSDAAINTSEGPEKLLRKAEQMMAENRAKQPQPVQAPLSRSASV